MKSEPSGSGRVLVVEDDEALGELISAALGESGYEVSVARSVAEAEAMVSRREFDMALLDMHLPDGTGADVTRRLIDDGAMTETIVLTGSRQGRAASATEGQRLLNPRLARRSDPGRAGGPLLAPCPRPMQGTSPAGPRPASASA